MLVAVLKLDMCAFDSLGSCSMFRTLVSPRKNLMLLCPFFLPWLRLILAAAVVT